MSLPLTLLLSLLAVQTADVNVKVKVPASGWYVLVRPLKWQSQGWIDELRQSSPQPVGPYPSEEMCRLAARVLMPDDRQFWPAAEKDAADQREKEAAALLVIRKAEELAKIRALPLAQRRNQTFWFGADGSHIQFNKAGKEVDGDFMTIATASGMFTGPRYIAVSGCLQVLGDNQS